jgi:hypothetical protein
VLFCYKDEKAQNKQQQEHLSPSKVTSGNTLNDQHCCIHSNDGARLKKNPNENVDHAFQGGGWKLLFSKMAQKSLQY